MLRKKARARQDRRFDGLDRRAGEELEVRVVKASSISGFSTVMARKMSSTSPSR
jgi:hypothetical protein